MGEEIRVDTIVVGTRVDLSGFEKAEQESKGILGRLAQGAGAVVSGLITAYTAGRAIEFLSGHVAKLGTETPGTLGAIARLSVGVQKMAQSVLGAGSALAGKVFDGLRTKILAAAAGSGGFVGAMARIGSGLASVATIAVGTAAALGLILIVTAAVAAVMGIALVASSSAAIDQQSKLAARVGASTQSLVGLMHASKLAGTEADALEMSVQKLGVNLAKADALGKGTEGAFRKLGVSAAELSKMDRVDAIARIADGIKGIKSPAEQAAVAVELFGKQGGRLLNLLDAGGAGIRAFTADADRLGLTFRESQGRDVEAANDAWTRVGESIQGVGNTLAIALAPASKGIADSLAAMISGANDLLRPIGSLIAVGSKLVGVVLTPITFAADLVGKSLHAVSSSIDGLLQGFMEWTRLSDGSKNKTGELSEETEKLIEFTTNLNEQLDAEIATFGKNHHEIELYKAALLGASEADQAQIKQKIAKLDALKAEAEANKKAKQAQEQLSSSAEDLTRRLKAQVATFGLESRAAQIQELALKGATAAQLAEARSLDAKLTALEKEKKLKEEAAKEQKSQREKDLRDDQDWLKLRLQGWERLRDAAKSVFADTRTPLEKQAADIRNLVALFDQRQISGETFRRGLLQAQRSANDVNFGSFAERGSQEARSRVLAFRRGQDANTIQKNTKDMVTEQRNTTAAVNNLGTQFATGLAGVAIL